MRQPICTPFLWALVAAGAPQAVPPPAPPGQSVFLTAFSPDGKRVVAVDTLNRVTLWDVSRVQAEPPPNRGRWSRAPFKTAPHAVAFSPDASQVFVEDGEGAVKILATGTGKETRALAAAGPTGGVVFLPDGKRLVSSHEKDVRLRDLKTGNTVRSMPLVNLPDEQFPGLAVSADGSRLLSWADYGPLKQWDLSTGKLTATLLPHPQGRIHSAEFHRAASVLVNLEGVPLLIGAASGKVEALPKGLRGGAMKMVFSRDGRRAVTGLGNQSPQVRDAASGHVLWNLPAITTSTDSPEGKVRVAPSVAVFSPDGKTLLLAGWVKNSRNPDAPAAGLWDVEKGRPVGRLHYPNVAAPPLRP